MVQVCWRVQMNLLGNQKPLLLDALKIENENENLFRILRFILYASLLAKS